VLFGGLDTIDASEVDTGLLGHSYIGDNESILSDVNLLLKGTPAAKRPRLRPADRGGQKYWAFLPPVRD